MSKGARQRKARQASIKVAQQRIENPGVRKAMNKEINSQLALAHDRFFQDERAVILWTLHQIFGFGAKRLRQYYDAYTPACEELRDHYEMSDSDMPFIATEKLKAIGVDLREWDSEG